MTNSHLKRPLLALLLGVCLLVGLRVEAMPMVSNLGNQLGQAWTIGLNGFDITDSPVANRFTTGSGPGWNLDSVVLNLGRFEGTTAPAIDDIDIYLAMDNGGLPGASVTLFPSVSPTNSVEIFTLVPQTGTVLAPNTAYWLVTSANVTDGFIWNFTGDVSQTGSPGWLIGDTAWGGYPSGSWTPLILPPAATPAPTLFQVNAAAVPEPISLALFCVGLAGLGWSRRKQA